MKIIFLKRKLSIVMIAVDDTQTDRISLTAFFWEGLLYYKKDKTQRGLKFEKKVQINIWDTWQEELLTDHGYSKIKAKHLKKILTERQPSLPFKNNQLSLHEILNQ